MNCDFLRCNPLVAQSFLVLSPSSHRSRRSHEPSQLATPSVQKLVTPNWEGRCPGSALHNDCHGTWPPGYLEPQLDGSNLQDRYGSAANSNKINAGYLS